MGSTALILSASRAELVMGKCLETPKTRNRLIWESVLLVFSLGWCLRYTTHSLVPLRSACTGRKLALGETSTHLLPKEAEDSGLLWPESLSAGEEAELRSVRGLAQELGVHRAPEPPLCPNVPHPGPCRCCLTLKCSLHSSLSTPSLSLL